MAWEWSARRIGHRDVLRRRLLTHEGFPGTGGYSSARPCWLWPEVARNRNSHLDEILETPKNHRRHSVNFSDLQEDLNHRTTNHCTHNPPILLQLTPPFPREAPPIPSHPHHSLHILVLYPLKKTPQRNPSHPIIYHDTNPFLPSIEPRET